MWDNEKAMAQCEQDRENDKTDIADEIEDQEQKWGEERIDLDNEF